MILDWIFCYQGRCWNNWQNLNPASGLRVCRSSVHYSCNFPVNLKRITFPPRIRVIYMLSPFLVHQLFDFRIHSWLSLLFLHSAQSIVNPQNVCGRQEGREGRREWGKLAKSRHVTSPARQFSWARFLDDAELDNDCGKFYPCFT